jgi:hypothetical protein
MRARASSNRLLKPNEIDPDNLSRLLELELIQKRATWKQAGERYRSIRAAGFIFLFVLIVGCLIGGYFALMRLKRDAAKPAKCHQQLRSRSLMSILSGEVTIPRDA